MGRGREAAYGAQPGVAAAEQVGGPEPVRVVAQVAGQAGEADPAALHDVGAPRIPTASGRTIACPARGRPGPETSSITISPGDLVMRRFPRPIPPENETATKNARRIPGPGHKSQQDAERVAGAPWSRPTRAGVAVAVSAASTIASEIWSATLSGWPSVTDSEVNRNPSPALLMRFRLPVVRFGRARRRPPWRATSAGLPRARGAAARSRG